MRSHPQPHRVNGVTGSAGKKAAGYLMAAFAAVMGAASASYNVVGPGQFGMRESFGRLEDRVLPSGLYLHPPLVSYTHSYNANTQIIEFEAGSCRFIPVCTSTSDQNPLTATVALHYSVQPDLHKLSYHRWEMDGWVMPDGYWLLTGLMNDSANAVFGGETMAHAILNPALFLDAFSRDFALRLEQNNVPILIDSLELKGFGTKLPTRFPSYEVRIAQPAL